MDSSVWLLSLLPEDEQREKSVSHQTVQQLVLEKEQALADLNSVEKSLADLFRRYEKMKEVLEGFRKVCLHSRQRRRWAVWGAQAGAVWEGPWVLGVGAPEVLLELTEEGVLPRLGNQMSVSGVLLHQKVCGLPCTQS
jgi:hypothetical protein